MRCGHGGTDRRTGGVETGMRTGYGKVAVAFVAAASLTSCGSKALDPGARPMHPSTSLPAVGRASPSKPVKTVITAPPTRIHQRPGQFSPTVVWRGARLIVTAYGSSTCPLVAAAAVVPLRNRISVVLQRQTREHACTADYAPHRSDVPAPHSDIDLARDVYASLDAVGLQGRWVKVELVHPRLS